jgi:ADP-ribose pyrophosphatase YjhB (NUDIX family)
MRKLHTAFHIDLEGKTLFTRLSTRAIVLRGDLILLLYTKRYEDFSLPGGGIDEGEDRVTGLARELREETGALNIDNIREFGVYEEYRPWYKPEFDAVHMISYCYTCTVDRELGETQLEHYEISNGMEPLWVNIYEAIAHNEETIKKSSKKGLSVQRETFLLRTIRDELVKDT